MIRSNSLTKNKIVSQTFLFPLLGNIEITE